ncbi:hypothetical protein X805_04750 [Sphaerotilus natans subsp. natans DSM 6575]|uniref:Uncharacterized protein n=1 Tax=Sphaerotilus natans subsp. natans DSM 6575 TaxID=1286631 RepID=A0A059KR63_9BURK|nr:hypothetical protein X805_04750 [Sphaerotilus natans subsp. natans DSM 6575]SIR68323.1 hypothetical protein SAMN05421778_11483 [Sphaerotilus natans]
MERTVVLVAPQGAGKSLLASELKKKFRCTEVVDFSDVDHLIPGALHLAHEDVSVETDAAALVIRCRDRDAVELLLN